mmetsp:Transcript_9375/g.22217  ORF Transcript_9375/g.22217 Transcript_9375/m.22217 type:complete len:356 (-) Transcript_9375:164-1231(-)
MEGGVERDEDHFLSCYGPVLDRLSPRTQSPAGGLGAICGHCQRLELINEEETDSHVAGHDDVMEVEGEATLLALFPREEAMLFAVVVVHGAIHLHDEGQTGAFHAGRLHLLERDVLEDDVVAHLVVDRLVHIGLEVVDIADLRGRGHALEGLAEAHALCAPQRKLVERFLCGVAEPGPEHEGRAECACPPLASLAVHGYHVLVIGAQPCGRCLTELDDAAEARHVVVVERDSLDLVVQKACVVVSIATLLVVLAQVVDQERAVVELRKEASNVADVVAVHDIVHARDRHRNEAVCDVGEIQIDLAVWTDESPLVDGHGDLQLLPEVLVHAEAALERKQASDQMEVPVDSPDNDVV